MQLNNWTATPSTSKVKLTSLPPKTASKIFEAQPMRSILSTRPISAYVSSSTIPKQVSKSKALYDFTDQIQDLREKEVSLEKAKADLWLAAENQRHTATIQDLNRQHETQISLIKQQHEAQLKLIQKEHQQELTKLEQKCDMLLKQANDQNQADRDAFKAQIHHLQQDHLVQQQVLNQRNEQKIIQLQAELREREDNNRRELETEQKMKLKQNKASLRQKMENQIQGIVSKLSDEHYETIKKLKEDLKATQDENLRLAVEYRDIQSRNRRQEDYIFELRKNLNEVQAELKQLKQPSDQMAKHFTEVATQTFVQTYTKETDVDGLISPQTIQYQETQLQPVLTTEELQEIVEYQRKQIQQLDHQIQQQKLDQEFFFETTKQKILGILRQSHNQVQSFKKQLMYERLQYEELAYMLVMLQPKQKTKNEQQIVKIED